MNQPAAPAKSRPPSTASSRDRLLDAAAELFYQEGVHVGVEALCKAAGVSKRSMYQLFASKDELISASLERSAPHYTAATLPPEDDGRPPRERVLQVFRNLEGLAAGPGYQGCPYVATATELKAADHPASRTARRYKDALTEFFRREAEAGGAADPGLLARQLTVVFDGAGARAVVQGAGIDGLAVSMADALLDAAGVRREG
jgi:AcrR family transcriptional regulator